jgi:hypothetical protein
MCLYRLHDRFTSWTNMDLHDELLAADTTS